MLDLNITMLFQFINFIIAIFFLNILLIRPVRDIIRRRNTLMDNMADEADKYHADAAARLDAYEAELARARKEAGLTRESGKDEGVAELQAILGRARESARQLLEDNRAVIQGQADQALAELRNGIDDFSTRLGKKLIG